MTYKKKNSLKLHNCLASYYIWHKVTFDQTKVLIGIWPSSHDINPICILIALGAMYVSFTRAPTNHAYRTAYILIAPWILYVLRHEPTEKI